MGEPLKNKIKYTASVFKDAERDYAVSFVGKELYGSIGKDDKVYGMELFEKKDINLAVELLKHEVNLLGLDLIQYNKLIGIIDETFPDLNT